MRFFSPVDASSFDSSAVRCEAAHSAWTAGLQDEVRNRDEPTSNHPDHGDLLHRLALRGARDVHHGAGQIEDGAEEPEGARVPNLHDAFDDYMPNIRLT